MWCWGAGGDGQLGDGLGSSRSMAAAAASTDVVELVPGYTLFYADAPTARSGAGDETSAVSYWTRRWRIIRRPAPLPGMTNVAELVTNGDSTAPTTCVRFKSGKVSCWRYDGASPNTSTVVEPIARALSIERFTRDAIEPAAVVLRG